MISRTSGGPFIRALYLSFEFTDMWQASYILLRSVNWTVHGLLSSGNETAIYLFDDTFKTWCHAILIIFLHFFQIHRLFNSNCKISRTLIGSFLSSIRGNWKPGLPRTALCKQATCTCQTCLSKYFLFLAFDQFRSCYCEKHINN